MTTKSDHHESQAKSPPRPGRCYFTLDEANRAVPYVTRIMDDVRHTYRHAVALQQQLERPLPGDDTERVQNDIMPQMVIYPALPTATIPEVYQKFAPVPESPSVLDAETIAANRDAWIREWTQAVLR